MAEKTVQTKDLINEKLPFGKLIPLGIQHVLAMYAGAVAVPLIVGGAIGLTPHQLAYLVSADLFTCGIATLIQAIGIGNFAGIKLPVVLGCTFTAVGPMIAIAKADGITAIYGSIIASGVFVIIFSYFFGKILKFFPPVVTGSVVTIIGLSLIPVAFNNVAGGQGSKTFGDPKNLLLALIVLVIIIAVNKFFTGFFQAISVLIGLIAGTLIGGAMGMVNLAEVSSASWFHIVTPFYFGLPSFRFNGIMTMILVAIVSMIESTGVFYGVGEVCDKEITEKDVVRGLRAEGCAQILGGIFNSFPYTTFSQNVGLISLTGVRSRFVVICAGVVLMLLGVLPKFAALATIMPAAVLGGAMVAMFGMVAVAGIRMLSAIDFTNNGNLLLVACSVGLGLGVTVVPTALAKLPQLAQILLGSGIVTGSLTAVILNVVLNFDELTGKSKSANN